MEDKSITSRGGKNELYLRILDQFPNPIWRSGVDTKCNFFNKNWLEFTGRTMDQEVGDGWVEGVFKDDLDVCIKTYLDSFAKREPFQMEYRLKHHDGTYHWILDSGSPFFDDNGVFLGYIGSCYDLQDIKEKMAQVESMNRMMLDRELKMVALKAEIDKLKGKTE